MRIADGVKHRRSGAVLRLQRGSEHLACCLVALNARIQRLLKVNGQRILLQRMSDLVRAQTLRIQLLDEQAQSLHIHVELIGLLVPNAVGDIPERGALALHLGVLVAAGQHRASGTAAHGAFRIEMACIGLQQNLIAAACLTACGQAVVHQEMMRRNHPVGAIGAEGLAVDEHRGLAAGGQAHDNALALRRLRQRHLAAHPAILKAVSPLRAHRHRREITLRSFLRREMLCGQESLHLHRAERQIEILLQRFHPVAQTALPFRMHVLH